jgi:hypothetical protein
MMVTENTLRMFAKEANSKYFNDELNISVISFEISGRMVRALGLYTVKNPTTRPVQSIKISKICISVNDWKNTMVHELVHAWQFQTGKPLDHGYYFKAKSDLIRRIDPKMIITTVCKDPMVGEAIRAARTGKVGSIIKWMITSANGQQVHFLRSVDKLGFRTLAARGFRVYKLTTPVSKVSAKQNINSLINSRTHYSRSIIAANMANALRTAIEIKG